MYISADEPRFLHTTLPFKHRRRSKETRFSNVCVISRIPASPGPRPERSAAASRRRVCDFRAAPVTLRKSRRRKQPQPERPPPLTSRRSAGARRDLRRRAAGLGRGRRGGRTEPAAKVRLDGAGQSGPGSRLPRRKRKSRAAPILRGRRPARGSRAGLGARRADGSGRGEARRGEARCAARGNSERAGMRHERGRQAGSRREEPQEDALPANEK